jgi:hypothetical protein
MSKHAHLSFGLIGPVAAMLLLTASGCGDDDGGGNKDAGTSGKGGGGGETAGSSGGGKGGSGGSGGSTAGAGGAMTGSGTLGEGDQCTTTMECGTGLTCIAAKVGGTNVRICARSCAQDTDCGKSDAGGKGTEVCDSPYTMLARDAHCINLEPDAFAYCGVGETSACDGDRACLYFPNSTIGVCVDLCATDPTMDAGLEGLPAMCPAGGNLKCVSNVVENPAVGVCGTQVALGGECGIETGVFCSGTDICVPDDLNADEGPQHCREDCTDTNACAGGGTCSAVMSQGRLLFRYCKK